MRDGEPIPLRPKEFAVLLALVENHGHLLTKDELLKGVWADQFVEEGNLNRQISTLRRVLGETPDQPQFVETVPRVGYRFVAQVQEIRDERADVVIERHTIARIVTEEEVEANGRDEVKTNRPSSVEYIITELKRHKRRAVSISGLIVLAVASYLGWRFWPATEEARTPPKNAAFTQLTSQAGEEFFSSLSPNGKSFVYASYASGNSDVYLQRVGGRNPTNLTKDSLSDDTQPAYSPDGEHIAFRSEREGGGIFVMGATGESVKRLTDFGFNPTWSPDSKEVACADENLIDPNLQLNPGSRIWAVNVATGEKRPVTEKHSMQPNWSPRGVRIAYFGVRQPGGQRDLWTIPAAGGEPVEVTNDQALDWNPVWSPDGKYLYFASNRAGSMNLWRVPVEENSGKVLGQPEAVTTPSPHSGHLSFSHDGKRMVYTQTVNRFNLQQVGFDPRRETVTGQPVWITQGSMWVGAPNLSPDGEWLAFDSQGGQQEDLFVIRRDGTSLRQLTNDIQRDRMPRWSPDGRRLAFHSDRGGNFDEIWLINSDGSGLQQLTYTSKSAISPVWSPDGTRLTYHTKGGTTSIIEVGKSWHQQSPEVLPAMSDFSEWFPWSWSPDGRKLAGWGVPGGRSGGISVYSLESGQYENLTDFGWGATWLSDSRRILFQARGKLYLVDSQSKKVREVLSVAPHGIGMVTVSRDDSLIYFSVGTNEADIWMMTLE
jgi:Tol biopolymer transport system component/DNA-binding winged helix-turn-helix (wHTH) protein